MKRTQVYLPEELHETVRQLSFEQRKSMAQLVRDAIASYVDEMRENAPVPWDEDLELLDEETRGAALDISGGELEELKRNPLYCILGMVSASYLSDHYGPDDDQTPMSIP